MGAADACEAAEPAPAVPASAGVVVTDGAGWDASALVGAAEASAEAVAAEWS